MARIYFDLFLHISGGRKPRWRLREASAELANKENLINNSSSNVSELCSSAQLFFGEKSCSAEGHQRLWDLLLCPKSLQKRDLFGKKIDKLPMKQNSVANMMFTSLEVVYKIG